MPFWKSTDAVTQIALAKPLVRVQVHRAEEGGNG